MICIAIEFINTLLLMWIYFEYHKIYFELGSAPEKIRAGEVIRAVINNRFAEFSFSILEE